MTSKFAFHARFLAAAFAAAAFAGSLSSCATAGAAPIDRLAADPAPRVKSGLDVLKEQGFAPLKGKRVGLIVNHSSIDAQGNHSIDLIAGAPDVKLTALFSPEHGIRGTEDRHVKSSTDEKTGVTIYSLYGETRKPTPEMLKDVDILVFDLQDIGARFYTYIATLGLCMEAAKDANIEYLVIDRPNPIRGDWFDGPIQDDDQGKKFTSFVPMPTVHGMTVGELALMYHRHHGIGNEPIVAKMQGWSRDMYFDETGLPWVNPSPNMRSVEQELLYTMVAQTEANKDVSVGRGTERPFEFLGAPWLDADRLTEELRSRNLPGIWVMRESFMPRKIDVSGRENYPYQFSEEVCQGVRFVVVDRDKVSPVVAGVHMLDALLEVHPDRYKVDQLRGLVGAQWVLDEIKGDADPDAIAAKWRAEPRFQEFAARRASVLLY